MFLTVTVPNFKCSQSRLEEAPNVQLYSRRFYVHLAFATMSRRAVVIEEEFDDDTELPLPNRALPNTGTKGAILEAFSDDEDDEGGNSTPGPASGPATPSNNQIKERDVSPGLGPNEVKDITPYKKCAIYYINSVTISYGH